MDLKPTATIDPNSSEKLRASTHANKGTKVLEELPVFRTNRASVFDLKEWRFYIHGAVKKPRRFSYDEITSLPRVHLTADFLCVEGWRVKDIEWEGMRVKEIITLAKPLPSARYCVFKAGGFTATLSLEEAYGDETILAYRYRGKALTFEHGAPLRLIFAAQNCYQSVKWVGEIEVSKNYTEGTGKNIALGRLSKS